MGKEKEKTGEQRKPLEKKVAFSAILGEWRKEKQQYHAVWIILFPAMPFEHITAGCDLTHSKESVFYY